MARHLRLRTRLRAIIHSREGVRPFLLFFSPLVRLSLCRVADEIAPRSTLVHVEANFTVENVKLENGEFRTNIYPKHGQPFVPPPSAPRPDVEHDADKLIIIKKPTPKEDDMQSVEE